VDLARHKSLYLSISLNMAKSLKSFSIHLLSAAKFIILKLRSAFGISYTDKGGSRFCINFGIFYEVTMQHIIMFISSLTGQQYLKHHVYLEITAIYFDLHFGEMDILFL
jgi:hypothetical protein